MTSGLTATHIASLQRALADGSLPPATILAMRLGPGPVSAAGRRRTSALQAQAQVGPTAPDRVG